MLTALHDAIVNGIQTATPTIASCQAYPVYNPAMDTFPAVFIEMVEITPNDNPGTEQLELLTSWLARLVWDGGDLDAHLQVRNLAVEVAQNIAAAGNFGQPVTRAEIIRMGADLDLTPPDLGTNKVWVVEWRHTLRVGQSAWEPTGIVPTEVYLGLSPDIGAAHQPDYTRVDNG